MIILLILVTTVSRTIVNTRLAAVDQDTVRSHPNFKKDYFVNNQTGRVMPIGYALPYLPVAILLALATTGGIAFGLRYCTNRNRDRRQLTTIITQNIVDPPAPNNENTHRIKLA